MKFFVPGFEKPKDAEAVLEATAKHVNAPFPQQHADRIYTLAWTYRGEKYYAQVGRPLVRKFGGEIVYAILRDGERFCVCTPNLGVLGGFPIIVNPDNLPAFVRFEP